MTKRFAPATTEDYQRLAEKRLPTFLYDYIAGGANDELTMAANIADFRALLLKQHVMRDVGSIDTGTILAGQPASMPLALAPVGMAGMMARRGEVQAARAAEKAGVPFTCSTLGVCSAEEINAATSKPFWFQLYMLHNRDAVQAILQRAKAAGCGTLVFTVDLPVAGMRHRDRRNGMESGGLAVFSQVITRPRWAMDVGLKGKPHTLGNLADVVPEAGSLEGYKKFVDEQFDPSATWTEISWLRSVWKGKLIIKGVMEANDALKAVDAGADGVVVSNHGGRQLDSVASSISKLPPVVSAIGTQAEVYMDGGVRSGIDVVKAVALGANGVLIGRPWVWAIAGAQEAGLTDLLAVFRKEISVAMALLGINKIEELHGELLEPT